MKKRFRATLETDNPNSQAAFVVIPFEVVKVFGARRVPVRGTLNGCAFQNTLSPYGGVHYLGVNKALRSAAKANVGDVVTIVLERDDELRTITPPPDLAHALKANLVAQAAWKKLSYSHQREYARAVLDAKKPETRTRRIEQTLRALLRKR